jgi:hypothetical protein
MRRSRRPIGRPCTSLGHSFEPSPRRIAPSSVMLSLCVLGITLTSLGQTQSPVSGTPLLQVRLDVPLDSKRSATGSPVIAATLSDWAGPGCSLAKGGVISGHIVDAKPHKGRAPESRLAVLFDRADCSGEHSVPVHLLLYAVFEQVAESSMMMYEDPAEYGSVFNHSTASSGLSSGGKSSSERIATDVATTTKERGVVGGTIHAGQVTGRDHIEMEVGTGPDGSSPLHLPRRDFRIEAGSTLVLVAPLQPESAAAVEHPPAAPPEPQPTPSLEATGPFAVPVLTESTANDANAILSLANLGYRPTSHPELVGFDHETTLHFLSDRELLLTFDPHQLREHAGAAWHARTRRTVRAVLLDAETKHIEQVMDWKVDEDGQYLWQAGPGRVLVHMNGGLYLLGAGLEQFAILPVHGDLLWVATSASGKRIAIGLRHERHDRRTHEAIEQLSGGEPEEDVEMLLLDDSGKTLLAKPTTSTALPPVLTDESEFSAALAGPHQWTLLEKDFNGNTLRTITTFTSQCAPHFSQPLARTLFVTGCEPQGARWYRVLSQDGHTLLKGRPSMEEIEDSIAGGGNDEFAIRTVKLANASASSSNFKLRELRSEHIYIHRGLGGTSLLAVTEPNYPVSRESYALSTDGRHLAVMTKADVEVFNVTAPN